MNRLEVIEKALQRFGGSTYLEIGVHRAKNFYKVRAKRKIAIDPVFKIGLKRRLMHLPYLRYESYFKMTSDKFFENNSSLFQSDKIDVALIDGLHTYEQTLKDIENTLENGSKGCFIIVHDCNPLDEVSATRATSPEEMREITGTDHNFWLGDVWKSILHLRATRSDLFVCTLDTDFGLGIVKFGEPENPVDLTPDQIADLEYADLEKNRELFLNLKKPEFLDELLK